jgi:hypothetical protein
MAKAKVKKAKARTKRSRVRIKDLPNALPTEAQRRVVGGQGGTDRVKTVMGCSGKKKQTMTSSGDVKDDQN